jgi:transposase-like protein
MPGQLAWCRARPAGNSGKAGSQIDATFLGAGRRLRSTYTREFKAKAVAACMQPGVSIASLTMDLRVNANMVRLWIREVEHASMVQSTAAQPAVTAASQLVPVSVAATDAQSSSTSADLRVTIYQGSASVEIAWPPGAEDQCAKLLREGLR